MKRTSKTFFCLQLVMMFGFLFVTGGATSVLAVDYTITVNASGTGTGTVDSFEGFINYNYPALNTQDSIPIPNGAFVEIVATANFPSIVSWDNCEASGGISFDTGTGTAKCTFFALDADKVLNVAFTPDTFTLTVAKAGKGSGLVTSIPAGIDCGMTCSGDFNYNAEVILTPIPTNSSNFTGWSGDLGCEDGIVTMTTDVNCTANFSSFSWNIFLPTILNSAKQ